MKERRGNWVSGEVLSKKLAISRSAVWKHIRRLRDEGYVITSSPKKGYLLRKTSPMLLPSEIRDGLETKVLGKTDIFHFRKIDSTNTRAKYLAGRGAPEGTLIIAETQTQGRGRKGRGWFSPAQKGIYLSLILRPTILPSDAPKITLLTAVAVAEAILSLTYLEVNIKWPNDILVNGKKMAGILTEISTEMDAVEHMVVGLGLNVNTTRFPVDISEKATSILLETGKPFPRIVLLREYLRWYERYYDPLKGINFKSALERWRGLTDMVGRQIEVQLVDTKYRGEVQGIDDDGVLLLKDPQGRVHRIFSGDVTFI